MPAKTVSYEHSTVLYLTEADAAILEKIVREYANTVSKRSWLPAEFPHVARLVAVCREFCAEIAFQRKAPKLPTKANEKPTGKHPI